MYHIVCASVIRLFYTIGKMRGGPAADIQLGIQNYAKANLIRNGVGEMSG
jgi:hypothetical protein